MKMVDKIQRVSRKKLEEIIEYRFPFGLYLTKDGRKWVAVDNLTGDAWTEEFRWKRTAVRWLLGMFEVTTWTYPKRKIL